MLIAYLKLSLRLLARNPFFTFINVVGLSVGFVAFFILWQHGAAEQKADQYHREFQKIARIGGHWRWTEQSGYEGHFVWSNILAYQTGMIFSDFPTVEHTRFIDQYDFRRNVTGMSSSVVVSVEDAGHNIRSFTEFGLIMADPNLFEFFTIPLIIGDPGLVLKSPKSAVLSKRTARRYFGSEDPINQTIRLNDTILYVVTGVFENLPQATHLDFDVVLSNAGMELQWHNPMEFAYTDTYVRLSGPEEFRRFEKELNADKLKYWRALNRIAPNDRGSMFLQPLEGIAFGEGVADSEGLAAVKSRTSLVILQVVAVVILLMAWINYMNLTVSRIKKRSREMGTRKVAGAKAGDFFTQFLIESLVLNAISVGAALTLIQLIRVPFEEYFEIQITGFQSPLQLWIPIACFVLSGVLITSLYPAYLCIRYKPKTLHDTIGNPAATNIASSLLTTLQYVAAFVLISWVFVIYAQLVYSIEKNSLGSNQIMILDAPNTKSKTYATDFDAFMNQVRSRFNATFCSSINGEGGLDRLGLKPLHHDRYDYYNCDGGVDETFVPFFGVKLLAGRNFEPGESGNTMLLSGIAARRMGFKSADDAIGERISAVQLGDPMENARTMEVIGVYEDYIKLSTMDNPIHDGSALVFKDQLFPGFVPNRIQVRLDRDNLNEVTSYI
ncbi:MAG: ABC transporter permease, partial [Cyclobacteriaceae bacterium]|nr:ABC transporter permease [Cyclobacteriaceae bacterium]